MVPICPDPPFPGVTTAVAVRITKDKMMSSVHRDRQTREFLELLESMTQVVSKIKQKTHMFNTHV